MTRESSEHTEQRSVQVGFWQHCDETGKSQSGMLTEKPTMGTPSLWTYVLLQNVWQKGPESARPNATLVDDSG